MCDVYVGTVFGVQGSARSVHTSNASARDTSPKVPPNRDRYERSLVAVRYTWVVGLAALGEFLEILSPVRDAFPCDEKYSPDAMPQRVKSEWLQ